MSAIAEFIQLPLSALGKLREDYHNTVNDCGESVVDYDWSGYVIATLLPYLEEKKGIDLTTSTHDDLVSDLCKSWGISAEIFTLAHKDAFLAQLSPVAFSKEELRNYYNEFHGTDEPDEVGQAMLDGIAAIQQSLAALDADSVILLSIG